MLPLSLRVAAKRCPPVPESTTHLPMVSALAGSNQVKKSASAAISFIKLPRLDLIPRKEAMFIPSSQNSIRVGELLPACFLPFSL
jgi:hypothetical protein